MAWSGAARKAAAEARRRHKATFANRRNVVAFKLRQARAKLHGTGTRKEVNAAARKIAAKRPGSFVKGFHKGPLTNNIKVTF